MNTYEKVLKVAHREKLPTRLQDLIEKLWINLRHGKEVRECDVEEALGELAEYFWMTNKFERIKEYGEQLYNIDEENVFTALTKINQEMQISELYVEKEYWRAMGYYMLYDYEEANKILRRCLRDYVIEKELEIKIRELLKECLEFYEEEEEEANRENEIALVELSGFDKEICEEFLATPRFEKHDEEINIIIRILKKFSKKEFWDILCDNLYIEEKYLVEIYEKVDPDITLSNHIYLIVLQYWIDTEQYDKFDENIEKIQSLSCEPEKIGCMQALVMFYKGKYEEAAMKAMDIIENEKECVMALEIFIRILFAWGQYEEVLNWIEITQEKLDESKMFLYRFLSLINLQQEQEAVKYFVACYNRKIAREDYIIYCISHKVISKELLIQILGELIPTNKVKSEQQWAETMISYVLENTNSYKNKGELRYKILQLYIYSNAIKKELRVDNKDVTEIYHYSRQESLKYLPKYSRDVGGSKLRLGNVAYLNDPEEGKVFLKILRDSGCMQEVYEWNKEALTYENTYLTSFSYKKDFLPMWVQYAEDGTGNCYAISTSVFDTCEDRVEENISQIDFPERFREVKSKYVLYEVFYYDKSKDDSSEVLNYCRKMGNVLDELLKNSLHESLKSLVNMIINEVRYLFKDNAYSNEAEVRVVCIDYNDEKKINTIGEGVPRFYMEIDKEIYFNKIILGPKANDIKQKSTYLSCCKNVGKVEKSSIKYV